MNQVDLKTVTFDWQALKWVPREICLRHLVFPIRQSGQSITIAMANPQDLRAIDDLKFLTGLELEIVAAPESDIRLAITRFPPAQPVG